MRGLYDDLSELADRLKLGRSSPDEALELLGRAEQRLADLRERSARGPGFALGHEDEIREIEEQSKRVKAAMLIRPDAPYVCIFRRPDRLVQTTAPNGDPITARLPSLCVLRAGDMDWLQRDGRQRVRDLWELLVDGVPCRPPVIGPRRWVMQNAQGAALMDATGRGPWWMTRPTAFERRRELYKTQRHNRKRRRKNRRRRNRSKMFMRHVVAPKIVDDIMKSLFREPSYPKMLRRLPAATTGPIVLAPHRGTPAK